ncbi:MAG: MipA/OmpV family protein [Zetaproteobacteria bacterium]|nr:MipA/OmpV family protein [Zetaproteobacteria bacterium]
MISSILTTLPMTPLYAAEKATSSLPTWEAGLAMGGASLPQYMGSDARYTFAAPIPYIIYRGDRVNVDRNGLRADLFDIDGLSVDASLGVGLPVRNTNVARQGMPSLQFSVQAGPRLNWKALESTHDILTLRIPARAVLDITGNYLGIVSEPDLIWEHQLSSKVSTKFSAGMLFAQQRYNGYYYSVDPIYANPLRPSYQAQGGLHSLSVSSALGWAFQSNWQLFAAMRYRNLNSGVVHNSPLVKTPHYLSVAFGITWGFYQSDR